MDASGKLRVKYLARGCLSHVDKRESGINATTFWLADNLIYHLSRSSFVTLHWTYLVLRLISGCNKTFYWSFYLPTEKKYWFIQKCCKISIAPTYYTKLQCGDWLLWTHLICNCRHCIDKEHKYNLIWFFFLSWFLSFIDLLCILMNCAVYFSGWSSTSDRYL